MENYIVINVFEFITRYNLEMNIERCEWKNGFIISVYRHGCSRSNFISDDELVAFGDDYLLSVIKDIVHELLEEEQKHSKVAEQFKKRD